MIVSAMERGVYGKKNAKCDSDPGQSPFCQQYTSVIGHTDCCGTLH